VLLDTHIALWLDSGSDRLRSATRGLIDECWRGGGTLYFSSVSVWEIALLLHSERVELDLPIVPWIDRFTGRPGIAAIPLSHRVAARAYELYHFDHRDPADRLLIATAIELDCPLVTYDARIQQFSKRHGRRYGFSAAAD
jgi:PIN domain nuclease of toxin-antitoxin system